MPPTLKISPHVVFRELGEGAVLLDVQSERYFGLDAIGVDVWKLLGASGDVSEIVEALSQRYGVSRERISEDVCRLLEELESANLLQRP